MFTKMKYLNSYKMKLTSFYVPDLILTLKILFLSSGSLWFTGLLFVRSLSVISLSWQMTRQPQLYFFVIPISKCENENTLDMVRCTRCKQRPPKWVLKTLSSKSEQQNCHVISSKHWQHDKGTCKNHNFFNFSLQDAALTHLIVLMHKIKSPTLQLTCAHFCCVDSQF